MSDSGYILAAGAQGGRAMGASRGNAMHAFERLDGFVERVEAAVDPEAIRLLLHDAVARLGFDYFACSLIDAAAAS